MPSNTPAKSPPQNARKTAPSSLAGKDRKVGMHRVVIADSVTAPRLTATK